MAMETFVKSTLYFGDFESTSWESYSLQDAVTEANQRVAFYKASGTAAKVMIVWIDTTEYLNRISVQTRKIVID